MKNHNDTVNVTENMYIKYVSRIASLLQIHFTRHLEIDLKVQISA